MAELKLPVKTKPDALAVLERLADKQAQIAAFASDRGYMMFDVRTAARNAFIDSVMTTDFRSLVEALKEGTL